MLLKSKVGDFFGALPENIFVYTDITHKLESEKKKTALQIKTV